MKTKLKQYRQHLDVSQAKLAEMIGVDRSLVTGYETGQYILNLKTAVKWAKALNCIVEDIYDHEITKKLYQEQL